MNWNDYRIAIDELPVSDDFEQRTCAAMRKACGSQGIAGPAERRSRRLPRLSAMGAFGKVAAVAAVCLALSGTAYAIVSFEDLAGIADSADQGRVAELFQRGEGVRIEETQHVGDFDITLLGLTSGEALMPLTEGADSARTYAVLSLARSDGSSIDDDYLRQSAERFCENSEVAEDGSMLIDAASFPKDESFFSADQFVFELLDFTPLAVSSDGAIAGRGETGVVDYAENGVVYFVVDMPEYQDGTPVGYLAVWPEAVIGSDLPGNRLSDRLVLDAQGAPAFAEGNAGVLFKLPQA
ncbi:hypothetical protein [uncultured Adlercreutzia sp.]|uniref:hypothetical protein n=1 Tax=uncultured Adlercreutzia sp. TaxID=875803 RepID=UPI00267565D9|nr:hypothetical protein [uncultured Adlercreutzia sp.]